MRKNIGGIDRGIRMFAGIAAIGAGVYFQSWWGAIGLIFIITSLIKWCPPYALLGISTCKKDNP